MTANTVLGIFVGGQARRMGGQPKGLLKPPGSQLSIVETLARRFALACERGRVVLVGQHEAYSHLGLPMLADAPPNSGPLGGLRALLRECAPGEVAAAVSCDMPYVSTQLFSRLLSAAAEAPALAARKDNHWQPFPARYDPKRALAVVDQQLAAGQLALHRVLSVVGCSELPLNAEQQRELRDWDSPEDIEA